ncbi:pyridoxamine kinase [Ruminococcaceae bacterium OttesenSCG-928-N02]|nr:pyridoxamine kinase [Ruminococcaceae bacterium OttesenSCG-928-N02]
MKPSLPRIAAFQDLCSFGRAALGSVTPTLSAMGVQVCPVPTALLSAHLGFTGCSFLDLTDYMQAHLAHWQGASLTFDGVFTGFFASAKQINMAINYIRTQPQGTFIAVDPVMGDHGKAYSSIDTEAFVPEMKKLAANANLITPNITEAALLLGREVPAVIDESLLKEWLIALSELGPAQAVITSVPSPYGDDDTVNTALFDRDENRFYLISCPRINAIFPGTGDTFTSVLLGAVLQGRTLVDAAGLAVAFLSYCMVQTMAAGSPPIEGVLLEKCLPLLPTITPTPAKEIY